MFASVFPLKLECSRSHRDLVVSAREMVFVGCTKKPTSANLKLPVAGAAGAAVGSPVRSTSLFAIVDVAIVECNQMGDDGNELVRFKPDNRVNAAGQKELLRTAVEQSNRSRSVERSEQQCWCQESSQHGIQLYPGLARQRWRRCLHTASTTAPSVWVNIIPFSTLVFRIATLSRCFVTSCSQQNHTQYQTKAPCQFHSCRYSEIQAIHRRLILNCSKRVT